MHRLSITFPDELIEPVKKLAKENGRSFGKEIVQIIKAHIAQEQKEKDATSNSILGGK